MKRIFFTIAIFLMANAAAFGLQRVQVACTKGGQTVAVLTYNSTSKVQASYPGCSVRVYVTGLGTNANLFSDSAGTTPLSNPYTTQDVPNGSGYFYVADGYYDVQLSGGGMTGAYTFGAVNVIDAYVLQSGAGAVSRLKAAKLNDVFSVKDFGAVGDGSTDDTTAIQAAITASVAQSATLLVPAGTYVVSPPTTAQIFSVPAGTVITGSPSSVIKIKNSAGPYRAVFFSNSCTGCSFSNLVIDGNISNNPIPNLGSIQTYPRIEYLIFGGSDITFDGLTVKNNSPINSFVANGLTVSNVTVTNCRTINTGDDPNHIAHDYSVVYASGSNLNISGNTFLASSVNAPGAVTGIETHGSFQSVTGNVITNFSAGMNITGIDPTGDSQTLSVTGNSISGAIVGIDVWSYTSGSHTTGNGINGLTIAGNSIRLNQLSYPTTGFTYGILLQNFITGLPMRNVTITGNTIVFDLENSVKTGNNASLGIGTFGDQPIHNLTISSNVIENAPVAGIKLIDSLDGVVVSRNTIRNAGSSLDPAITPDQKVPMFIGPTTSNALVIDGNVIVDDLSVSRTRYSALLSCTILCTGTRYTNNELRLMGADTSAFVNYVEIQDNNILPLIQATMDNYTPTFSFKVKALSTFTDPTNGIIWRLYTDGVTADWTKGFRSASLSATGMISVNSSVSPFQILQDTSFVVCDTSSGVGITIYLPGALGTQPLATLGQIVTIKKTSAINPCLISGRGFSLVDGQPSVFLWGLNETRIFQFDGTNWQSIANNSAAKLVASGIVTKVGAYSATGNDSTVICDSTSGDASAVLPLAPVLGQFHTVKKKVAANHCVLSAFGLNIDGATTASMSAQYSALTVQWDGTQWWIVNYYNGTLP